MPTNSHELLGYAEYALSSTEYEGSQGYRTACHKAYYSCYHYFSDAFPAAAGMGRAYLKAIKKSPTAHLSLREGIMELSKSEKNPSKKRFLNKLSLALGKLHGSRCNADYELGDSFTAEMAAMAIRNSRKLQDDHQIKFKKTNTA